MSGRAKQPTYQYSAEGKFLKKWESQADVRAYYFKSDTSKRPFYYNSKEGKYNAQYQQLPDGTYISNYKIGRDNLLKQLRVDNCIFCKHDVREKVIEVFNLLNEKVAEFSSLKVANLLTGVDEATLHSRCKNQPGVRFKPNSDNLIYKFK